MAKGSGGTRGAKTSALNKFEAAKTKIDKAFEGKDVVNMSDVTGHDLALGARIQLNYLDNRSRIQAGTTSTADAFSKIGKDTDISIGNIYSSKDSIDFYKVADIISYGSKSDAYGYRLSGDRVILAGGNEYVTAQKVIGKKSVKVKVIDVSKSDEERYFSSLEKKSVSYKIQL